MLNDKEVEDWYNWLQSEQRRLEDKKYTMSPQYKANNSKLIMLDIILGDQKLFINHSTED